jgi:hypothetical protein
MHSHIFAELQKEKEGGENEERYKDIKYIV